MIPEWAAQQLVDDAENLPPASYCGILDTNMSEDQLRLFARSLMAELEKQRNRPNPFIGI